METALPPDSPQATGSDLGMSSSSAPVPPVPQVAPVTAPAPLSDAPVYDVPVHKDRGTGLVIFGVFQIILGLLAALMVPLIALGAFVSRLGPAGAMRPAQFLSGVATYGSIAAAMLALGIGSVQMKRWARALTLVTSWYWLITGVLITILLTAVLPVTMKSALAQINKSTPNAPSPEMSTGIMAVILTLIIIFAAFFLIVVPIAFVIFYGRKDVGETCRHRDPVERWTDRTPLPVLGASVILFIGALYLFMMGVTTPLFPFFGRYLTGPAGSAGFVLFAALDAYLAVGLFRLRSLAWWIAVCATPIRIFSVALSYAHADLMQAYSKIGFSDAQVQMIGSNPMLRGHVLLWWGLLSQMLFFGFLLWLKRYFKPDAPAPAEVLSAQVG